MSKRKQLTMMRHMPTGNPNPRSDALPLERIDCLSAFALQDRLEEEINRAGRHGTPLSCLLVAIEDLAELASRHGRELGEQALAYAGPALLGELRRFDRVGRPSDTELLVVLPGADGPHFVRSPYGHDAFLIETDQVADLVKRTLTR